jgi:geranylgeranyl diphosphate synthase, type I
LSEISELTSASESSFLRFSEGVRRQVERELRHLLSGEMRVIHAVGPEAVSSCSALSDVCMRGGKRLRATLVCIGARCLRQRPNDALLIRIGAAVELLHAYFLVHDDWMDGDLVRRGGPSAHATLRNLYGKSAGDAAAILAGDWGATVANDWMAQLPLTSSRLRALLSTFSQMQRLAIGGQLRDTLVQGDDVEYTYRLKTASYTVQGPLALGAIAVGANSRALNALGRFAIPVGVAFQLRDDLLSLFGSESATGKPFGSDLRAGKHTMAARYAWTHVRGSDRRLLAEVFGNSRAPKRQLTQVVEMMDRLGTRRHVEQRIAKLLGQATGVLRAAPFKEQGRLLLASAANALALRST